MFTLVMEMSLASSEFLEMKMIFNSRLDIYTHVGS